MTRAQQVQGIAWGLSGGAAALAIIAWGQDYGWRLTDIGVYQFFPLLGLLAFSLMWSHYIASVMRRHFEQDSQVLHRYFEITSAVVLVAILLHPVLLGWQLWSDGLGLPPGSYKLYVGASSYWAVIFGLIAWLLFLSYELRRVYGKRSWWRFVQYGSDGAMLLIFVHALRLGSNLQSGWFRGVWFFYGVTLLWALFYGYSVKYRQQHSNRSQGRGLK